MLLLHSASSPAARRPAMRSGPAMWKLAVLLVCFSSLPAIDAAGVKHTHDAPVRRNVLLPLGAAS